VPLSDDVDLSTVASSTPGMVGADLRNLVNEAARLAATRGRAAVVPGDFTQAMEKIVLGAERRITISPEERERIAYHESGHAILGMVEPGADPVPLFPGAGGGPSEATRELVDAEARRIIDECYERALESLREHRGALEALARALLDRETLDEPDAYEVAGFERPARAAARDGGPPVP